MAFTPQSASAGPMSDINVTPLIDVLLCLLIIFILNAPSPVHQVDIDLPQRSTAPPDDREPPPPIELKIRATGELFWNGMPLIKPALEPQLEIEAGKDPQPQLEIDAEFETEYQVVAEVLAIAKNKGMTKIGFKNMPSN
jgi:biopolymer transport protein ExbD